MIKRYFSKFLVLGIVLAGSLAMNNANAQLTIGLDNWFNHEINKAGKPAHYLWSDTTFGGYSRWGQIFINKGAKITTLDKPLASVLSSVNVYIIVDPDTTTENPNPNYIGTDDADAIEQWVKAGGVLAIMANDAPNCEFTHLNQLSKRFGIQFNHVSLHPVLNKNFEMGASINLPSHPIFKDVKKIYIKEISSFTLTGNAKSIFTENGQILMAECHYGKGLVWTIGDPWIYNEYIDHDKLPEDFQNRKAAENLSDYLLSNAKK